MLEIVLSILGGLALFLFAVNNLSDTIRDLVGQRSEKWVLRFTKNLFTAIVTGAVVTTLLDSSSATIIITIVMVNAGLLTFRQAIGIVLGSNVGTTVSSQIIAMDVGMYSPVFLIFGLVMVMVSKTKNMSNLGKSILYFGILFFGLFTMERAVEPLKDDPLFFDWMERMKNPLMGTFVGALVTLIIQSSSATVGISIVLVKKGILSLGAGIAVMMGAELGTVSDTLLATIKGSRQALKTGLFHLVFNLISIIVGFMLFYPFQRLVEWVSNGASAERALANAHMLFNIMGVLLFVWFVPFFENVLNKVLPDTMEGNRP
jgi:phosphate:Na+ symporter